MHKWQLKLNHIDFYECQKNWSFRRSELSDFDLLLFRQGGGVWSGPDGQAVPTSNSCIMLEKGKKYTGQRIADNHQCYFFIHYDYIDNSGNIIIPEPDLIPSFSSMPNDFNLLYEMAGRCMDAYRRTDAGDEPSVWLKTILISLLEQKRLIKSELGDNVRRINKLCLFIKENIHRKWRLNNMAARVNCSPDHFAVIFKKCLKTSPGEWVINCRVNRAKTLLRYSPKSISEIADALGYCDIYAFSKQFKKVSGMTPKQYRIFL